MNHLNTILFDLDGTLLPISDQDFEKLYFGAMVSLFTDIYTPEELIQLIWECTKIMVKDTSDLTNEKVFFKAFEDRVGDRMPEFMRRFDAFYQTHFDVLKTAVKPSSVLKEAVQILKAKGYTLVIATNPMFPRLAIEKRIEWTGLNRVDFSYVTSFEDNHFCKPQLQYYQEILQQIKKDPSECLMVGNDVTEDMVAGKLGIHTYLLKDYKIQKGEILHPAEYEGSTDDFLGFVHALNPAFTESNSSK